MDLKRNGSSISADVIDDTIEHD